MPVKNPDHKNALTSLRRKRERYMAVVALLSLTIAWWTGQWIEITNERDFLNHFTDSGEAIVSITDDIFAEKRKGNGNAIYNGFYVHGKGSGYGGPLYIVMQTDRDGVVQKIVIRRHRETSSYLKKVLTRNFTGSFHDISIEQLSNREMIPDGISGATSTCDGISGAVIDACQNLAGEVFGLKHSSFVKEPIVFGFPEIVLILLFSLGFIGRMPGMKYQEIIRWVSLLSGMLFLGFIFNNQVTISKINSYLLGFWPGWRSGLYWIMLLGGIVGILILSGKNVYCYWFCPFGAAQECLSKVGNAKRSGDLQISYHLKWIQRSLAWIAIIIALVFRNPGISSYEVFGGLFDLTATLPLFLLLGVTLIVSLFIHRPWCTYLCPMDPVFTFISLFKKWIPEIWRRKE